MKAYKVFFILLITLTYSCSNDNEYHNIQDKILETQITELYGSLDALIMPSGESLNKIPSDPKNKITSEKIALGKLLFHETGLAINPKITAGKNTYSCASCHHSKAGFQSGMKQGVGEGGIGFGTIGENRTTSPLYDSTTLDIQPIRSPTILNTAYQKVMLWNGQFGATGPNKGTEANWTAGSPKEKNNLGFEGVETQAIAGLDVHRLKIDPSFITSNDYKELFDNAFPNSSAEEKYSTLNAALAIAAYERSVLSNQAPFQKWLKGDKSSLSEDETKGANLFFGKAKCYTCHSGPGLNGMNFHALGMRDLSGDDFEGTIDDATKKGRGGFTNNPEDDYKFKTPTLYNLKDVNHLGHGGSFLTIKEVLKYKNNAIAENKSVPKNKLSKSFNPLNLTDEEITQLSLFIEVSLYDNNLSRYVPDTLPSNNCFPNADDVSKQDMSYCE